MLILFEKEPWTVIYYKPNLYCQQRDKVYCMFTKKLIYWCNKSEIDVGVSKRESLLQ